MFVGTCFNEFPLSTSEEMTKTFNGDVEQKEVYINKEESVDVYIERQIENEIYIEKQVNFTLEQ